jgi:drug/metabolite transporter (DMT)-like permease
MIRRLVCADRRPGAAFPLVILTLVVLIWSSNNIATKIVLEELSPGLLTLVRFTLTTVVFHLPTFLVIRRIGQPLSRADWIKLGIASLFGYALSALMFMVGISMTTATFAGLMMMTAPLWTAVLERIFVGTPIGGWQAVGMLISFASAAFLATGGSIGEVDTGMLLGGILLMCCQTTWGGYTIVTKPMLARRPPLVIVTASSIIATPAIWPATALMGAFGELALVPTWSTTTWLGIAYLVLVAGVLSQVMYAYGLRDVTPSQAMAFTYLMPVFTAFFAAIFLDEQLTLVTVVCGSAIVFGLWLVNRSRAPATPSERRPVAQAGGQPPGAPSPTPDPG